MFKNEQIDETRDGYTLWQSTNKNYDYYSENEDELEYTYEVYNKDLELIYTWNSNLDAEKMTLSAYRQSELRRLFIRYVNIDRAENEPVKEEPKKQEPKKQSYRQSSLWNLFGDETGSFFGPEDDEEEKPKKTKKRSYTSYTPKPAQIDEEIFEKYNKSKTLCLHKSDPTTTMLDQIYAGKDWDVINDCYEVDHTTLHALIDSHERIVMLGHGTPRGLIGSISDCCAEHLKGKKLFMLWCNADGYWAHHKDLGTGWFCTGNLPSDNNEAAWVGYKVSKEYMLDNITYWCKLCGDVVEECLEGDAKKGTEYIREKYWEKYGNSSDPNEVGITTYNYQRTKVSGENLIPEPNNKNTYIEALELATPYMLRNDGELLTCGTLHPYIRYIHESKEKILELFRTLDPYKLNALDWFYKNSTKTSVKKFINIVWKYFKIKEVPEEVYSCVDDDEILTFIDNLNVDTNQEFLRIRMSALYYGGNSNELYARISSLNFNWYPLLFKLVLDKDISNITITKDSNTFGDRFTCYKIGDVEIDHLPKEEFIMLKGNPIAESYKYNWEVQKDAYKKLKEGFNITEVYPGMHPKHVLGFYERHVEDSLKNDLINSQYKKEL